MAARLFLLHLREGGFAECTLQGISDSQRTQELTEQPKVEWPRTDGRRQPGMLCLAAGKEESEEPGPVKTMKIGRDKPVYTVF